MMVLCKFKKSVKYYINYILLLNYHIPFLLKTFFFFYFPSILSYGTDLPNPSMWTVVWISPQVK